MSARLLLLCACTLLMSVSAKATSFERDVRPILKEHCFHCHGEGDLREGELDLRLRRWIVSGGSSGPAVVPGDLDASLLMDRIVSGDMPPGDSSLAEEEIDKLRNWIEQGAKVLREEPENLDDGYYITEEERSFWAFQPIANPTPPQTNLANVKNPIDAFVGRRLVERGLSPSKSADRNTLLRRATLDLWGLPPDPEMVRSFLTDTRPQAYERLIEELLASPRYGERWGRHWLDVAGYADSEGYTDRDIVRDSAYFYRDYVIDSLNAGKPFDVFVKEQLAGDEMGQGDAAASKARFEQLAATGFLRMAPDGTADGSVDRGVAANDTIASTLEIVSTSLLGLTVGCARCHDHRYDPISQADYYQFRAIFAPALDSLNWKTPQQRKVSLYTAEQRKERAAVEARAKEAVEARAQRQKEHIARTLEEELLVVPDKVRDALREAYQTAASERSNEQKALLESHPNVANISNGSLYLYAEQRARRASDIERVAGEREQKYVKHLQMERIAAVESTDAELLRSLLDVDKEQWSDAQKSLAEKHPEVFIKAADLETLWPEKFAELTHYREAAAICRKEDAKTELAEMQKEVEAIRSTAPPEHFLRILTEPANHLPETHLFIRGDHNQPGEVLQPAELQVLEGAAPNSITPNDPDLNTSGRRLAYAKHLTSGEHPLFARVIANRIWMQHFGRGLVATPGDFGQLGERPTHPALLDWLATELVSSNWNLKHLHRLIMQSHTYRQSSRRTEESNRVDPDNRWLSRMSVKRLESEVVRDAVLAVSGQLSNQMHGPPVPVKEDAVGQIVIGVEMLDGERKPTGSDAGLSGASRRSIYVQVRRTRPLAVLETFDLPANAPNCVMRRSSNVATQSLMMMNSEFVVRHAEKMAARLIAQYPDAASQLRSAWQLCVGRDIDPESLAELSDFVEQQTTVYANREAEITAAEAHHLALASACQAILGSNAFLYVD